MSFLDEYCVVFDDEDENKLEFTKIHNVSCTLANLVRISRKSSRTCCKN
jgi:hypothetical protein